MKGSVLIIGVINSMDSWLKIDKEAIVSLRELRKHFAFPADDKNLQRVCNKFPIKITSHYLSLIDSSNSVEPLKKMVFPDKNELNYLGNEDIDPIGDIPHTFPSGEFSPLIHRYPDRVLLNPTSLCGGHCRFCFRKRIIGRHRFIATKSQMENAFDYIRQRHELHEVILSGGDPLMLQDGSFFNILERLRKIKHVQIIRIHTRMPVWNPFRITENFVRTLKKFQPIWLVTHINHPKEISDATIEAILRLVNNGIPLLNQSVLLSEVNDSVDVLRDLFLKLVKIRVKPYYLHHLDQVFGSGHFRVKMEKGVKLIRLLKGTIPGYALPAYTFDIPGGYGKIPINYNYFSLDDLEQVVVETPFGNKRHLSTGQNDNRDSFSSLRPLKWKADETQ